MNSVIDTIHSLPMDDDDGKMKPVTLRLPTEVYKELTDVAARRGFLVSGLLGKIIKFYLDTLKSQGLNYDTKAD